MTSSFLAMDELSKRHGDHHYINVKYGYGLLIISLIYYGFVIYMTVQKTTALNGHRPPPPFWFKVYLHIIIWLVIMGLLFVSFWHEFNWSSFLKRFGRLSYCLVPLDLLLIIRPNFVNYITLIGLHKWISRLIVLLATIHSIGYLIRWGIQGQLIVKVFTLDNSLGLAIFLCLALLAVVSLKPFRTVNYVVFYLMHNISVMVLIVFINIHARPGVFWLTVLNIILLLFQTLNKFNVLKLNPIDIKRFGNLVMLSFDKPPNYPITLPGSHLRIGFNDWSHYFLPSHPFTFVETNQDDATGNARLELIFNGTNKFAPTLGNYLVSLPYNSMMSLDNYNQVVLFVGGSGVSFALSVMQAFGDQHQPSGLNVISDNNNPLYPAKIKVVWVTKNPKDLGILDYFNIDDAWDLYITQAIDEQTDEGVEMELINEVTRTYNVGRPNLDEYHGDLFISVGPQSLNDEVQALATTRSINCICEVYGF